MGPWTEAGIRVLGVSPDPAAKHVKFMTKYGIPFDLACDEDLSLHEAFGVWGLKKFMGKEYEGTHRTTFLIDEQGHIVDRYPQTKNEGSRRRSVWLGLGSEGSSAITKQGSSLTKNHSLRKFITM